MNKLQKTGIEAVTTYLCFKYSSGLLEHLSWNSREQGARYFLRAIWGTYHQLVLPELLHLCREHALELARTYKHANKNNTVVSIMGDTDPTPQYERGLVVLYVGNTALMSAARELGCTLIPLEEDTPHDTQTTPRF
jgi:hypothetical protein